jgi:hypothetical protein
MEPKMKTAWVKYFLIALVCEKIVQHIFVTCALYFNWNNIQATVAINPAVLMILGAIAAVLFLISLWGLIKQRKWTTGLMISLAVFDILGEFVAQGRIGIMINVSFLVAITLPILALTYRR